MHLNILLATGFTFVWQNPNFQLWDIILTLVFIVAIYGILVFVFAKACRRRAAFVFLGISATFTILGFLLDLYYVSLAISAVSAAGFAICLFANLGDVRQFIANPFKKQSAKVTNFGVEKIFNRKDFYKKIETTVIALSKSRTGAIMTFERNASLKDIIKNGVPINAPVSPELLQTIFYEGTRLHDGAVIIHNNEIVAASVFFTPTTKPFAGKYGSRHRAAIGISEISDSVTVVVSEETGRISLAVNGNLDQVAQENFIRVFENYMSEFDPNTENEED